MERAPLRTLCHKSPLKLAENSSKHAGHDASHASRRAAQVAQRHSASGKRARTATPPRHMTSEWAPQLTAAGHAGCSAMAPPAAAAEPDSGRSLGGGVNSCRPGGEGPASSPAPPPVSPWAAELLNRWDGRWDALLSSTPSTPTTERPAYAPRQPRAPNSPGQRAPPDAAARRRSPLAELVAAVEAEVAADAACARAGAAAGGPGPGQGPAQTPNAAGGGDTDELFAALLGGRGRPRGPGQGQGQVQGLRLRCPAAGSRDPHEALLEADQAGEAAQACGRTAPRDAREADAAAGGRSQPDGQRGGALGKASAGGRAARGAGAGGACTGRFRAVRCRSSTRRAVTGHVGRGACVPHTL